MKANLNRVFVYTFVGIILISIFLAGVRTGKSWGYKNGLKDGTTTVGAIQTVTTAIDVEPLVLTKLKVKKVYVRDSIFVKLPKEKDTVYIPLPREVKVYEDTLYRAVVSGYMPSLDSLSIYRSVVTNTVTIHSKQKPTKWGVGLTVGYGLSSHNGTIYHGPHIGVGVSYNFIRF